MARREELSVKIVIVKHTQRSDTKSPKFIIKGWMYIMKRKSNWEWYAVKLLFESTISGEPNKDKIDEHYDNKFKLYEEQIIVVRAQSFDHAYKKAEVEAKKNEMEYNNPYDQLVQCKFVDSLNCQRLFDKEIKSGTEIYSRLFKVPIEEKTNKVIETYVPEIQACEDKTTPFYNFLINE